MIELTERRKEILAVVVREYIATAVPVGSSTIARAHDLGVSPATIRNEMAALEEAGFLTHPHTSAGRMPTVKGYRYFVEQLMETGKLQPSERRLIRRQFDAAGWEPEAWMRHSAAALAQVARSASVVTAPRPARSQFKHMELVELRGELVLLVLVLADGSVEQARFSLTDARSQAELSVLADQLNQRLAGLDRHAISELELSQVPALSQIADWVAQLMADVDRRHSGEVVHAGIDRLLSQPEFAGSGRATEVVQVFERGDVLGPILADVAWGHRRVHIIIAGGDRWDAISDYGLVLADYGAADTWGAVGVLGPVRMPYERAVSAVRYVSDVMSQLLSELYGAASAGSQVAGTSQVPVTFPPRI